VSHLPCHFPYPFEPAAVPDGLETGSAAEALLPEADDDCHGTQEAVDAGEEARQASDHLLNHSGLGR
jgi:hypothetical protein